LTADIKNGMDFDKRWMVRDRYGNDIYLTDERWEHIIDPDKLICIQIA